MSKAGLAVCSLLQQHFSKALKESKEKIDALNGELTSLAESTEVEGYRNELQSRVQKALNDISTKCETEAKNLTERSSRKRTREPAGPAEVPPKRTRPNNGPPVLNTTLDRDTAITMLFEGMNDVSDQNNINSPTYSISPPTDKSPATPTKRAKLWPRPRPTQRKGKRRQRRKGRIQRSQKLARPPKPQRLELRKKRHSKHRKKHNRLKTKLISNSKNIMNLSAYILSTAELSILSKGLSYIPKPKHIDQSDALRGLCKLRNQVVKIYETKMKAKTQASSNETTNPPTTTTPTPPSQETNTQTRTGPAEKIYYPWDTIRKFKHKRDPTGHPTTNKDLLNQILSNIKKDVTSASETTKHSRSDNTTRAERLALQQLKNNNQIVINKADKGSTIVIVNRNDYIEDGLKHLDDPTVYRKLKHDTTPTVYFKIINFLKTLRWQSWIPPKFVDFCTPPEKYRTSQLYFLKKIHKNPMGIRSIVSSVNSVTENISSFVDGWLNPLVQRLPSFIKDSMEFIKLVTTTSIPQNSTLVSIDVSSLYTNIPHRDGIEACIHALNNDQNPDPLRPPVEILTEMLNIELKNNVIDFNGDFFLQLQGTAMGTKMAPAYANLFMGSIEPRLQTLGLDKIHTWKRYIDDIFVIWLGSNEELTTFISKINQVHPTIKFTYEHSDSELTFLDVTVYKGPQFKETGLLDVKTHNVIKPTNKQLYIHKKSYHPECTKAAIPKGEIQRYLRSNTREDTFTNITKQLKTKLIERGYKSSELTKIIDTYPFSRREELMSAKGKKTDTAPLVLPVKFSPLVEAIRDILRTHWPEIGADEFLKEIFPDKPMIAKRRNKTLANILVRSKIIGNEPNRPLANSRLQHRPCGVLYI